MKGGLSYCYGTAAYMGAVQNTQGTSKKTKASTHGTLKKTNARKLRKRRDAAAGLKLARGANRSQHSL